MNRCLCLSFFALLLLSGCSDYKTQFEGPYDDSQNQPKTPPLEILTLQNGRIVLYDRGLRRSKTLGNLPAGISKASINHAHNRIAYQIAGQNIMLTDTSGTLMGPVPNSANAAWFDWHTNNQTLIMLIGATLSFSGPPVTAPTFNLTGAFPAGTTERTVPCAMITGNGNLVAVLRYLQGASGYQQRIVVAPAGGGTFAGIINSAQQVNWLRADKSGNRVLVGSLSPSVANWDVNISAATIRTVSQSRTYAAIGPLQELRASFSGSLLSVQHTGQEHVVTISLGSVGVSALDW